MSLCDLQGSLFHCPRVRQAPHSSGVKHTFQVVGSLTLEGIAAARPGPLLCTYQQSAVSLEVLHRGRLMVAHR